MQSASLERRHRKGTLIVRAGAAGPFYEAKWRDSTDRQIKRRVGPAWLVPTAAGKWKRRPGRPREPFLEEKDALARMWELVAEHESTLARTRPSDSPQTFGELAEEWLVHGQRRRGLKRSTLGDYRQALNAYILPDLGDVELLELSAGELQRWHSSFEYGRTAEKVLMIVRAVLAYGLRRKLIDDNPGLDVERHAVRYSGDYDWYSREEVDALVRAAAGEQDAAIYVTAALTGIRRGELLALRWRDIDFVGQAIRVRGNLSQGEVVTPKSGKVRTIPMVPVVARVLAHLGQRARFTEDDDPVFCSVDGGHLDPSALRRRYVAAAKRAGLRPLPFHSLRHHFGSTAIDVASVVQVKEWMGHSEVATTMRYLHHKEPDDRRGVAGAGL